MRALDGSVDLVFRDVDQAIVFRAGSRPFLVFLVPMKRQPYPTVSFTIAQQSDLFGRRIGDTKWLKQEDKLVKALTIDEGRDVSFANWIVNIE